MKRMYGYEMNRNFRLFMAVAAVMLCTTCFAQDVIYTKDNQKIDGCVLNVSSSDVLYKTSKTSDEVLTIPVSQLRGIVYENGEAQFMDTSANFKQKNLVVADSSIMKSPYIVKVGSDYLYQGVYFDEDDYVKILRANCSKAYYQYVSGRQMIISGWTFLGVGLVGEIACFLAANHLQPTTDPMLIVTIGVLAGTFELISIPLLSVGYTRKNNAIHTHNKFFAPRKQPVGLQLSMNVNTDGLGVKMSF